MNGSLGGMLTEVLHFLSGLSDLIKIRLINLIRLICVYDYDTLNDHVIVQDPISCHNTFTTNHKHEHFLNVYTGFCVIPQYDQYCVSLVPMIVSFSGLT